MNGTNTDKMNTSNLLFVMADVLETNLMDARELLRKDGQDYRQQDKRNFNTAIHAIKSLKHEITHIPEEEQEDLIAEEIYKEKYAVVVAPAKKPEPVKEETKTVKVETKTEVVEEKVAPKVEEEKPAETKVEETTEVKKKGIDRVIEMFDAQIAAKTDPYKVTRKAIEVLVSEGSGKAKAVIDIMQNVDAESRWKLAINRPEVLKDKFGLSKEEVATVLETMKPYFGLK